MGAAIGDLIREAVAAYERGGFEAVLPFAHRDVEVFAPPEMINAGESRGQEEAAAWNREWEDAWEAQRYEIAEIEEVDPNRAVASALVTTTGRSSGVTTEMRQWWFFEARDGKIARWHLYPDRERAFALASESRSESD
jgi:ketosteroid isomerase-like protein